MRRLLFAAVSLALLAACQPGTTELTEEQRAALADSVRTLHAEMWQPWLAGDVDGGMRYFLNSPDLGCGLNGAVRYGYDNIVAWYRPLLAGIASQELTLVDRRVFVLARDIVCVMEHGTIVAADTAGVTLPASAIALTTIWVRRDGEWKVHLGHESTAMLEPM